MEERTGMAVVSPSRHARARTCPPCRKTGRLGISRLLFPLCLLAWTVAPPAAPAAGGTGMALHHRKQMTGCRNCHTEGPLFKQAAKARCAECHQGNGETAPARFVPASETVKTSGGSEVEDRSPDEAAGMGMPMYYEGTRLGGEPNEMIRIPAGEFLMGSDNRLPDEGPRHTVNLKAFLIDKYEVTNLQYQRFINATGRHSPSHFKNRTFPPGKADHPVTFVSWYDAAAYCKWAGKRLPTDEEWEKAARGTDGRSFPWGNEFAIDKANTPVRWARLKQEGDTTPVGAFADGTSPYGLYDMSGNVWEWTASWYQAYPGNKKPSENYGEKYRVLKGGSWWDCSFYKCGISAPVFNRSFFNPRVKNASFGFRCARDAG